MSHGAVTGAVDLVAMDGLSIIGTAGFFVPAAAPVALVVGAVVPDRRLSAREQAVESPENDGITPPRAG